MVTMYRVQLTKTKCVQYSAVPIVLELHIGANWDYETLYCKYIDNLQFGGNLRDMCAKCAKCAVCSVQSALPLHTLFDTIRAV